MVGGKHKEANNEAGLGAEYGQLLEVDDDMPLTLTELVQQDGKEYIMLHFAPGDKENPFNWSEYMKCSHVSAIY